MLKCLLEFFCLTLGVSLNWPVMLLWDPNWQRGQGRENMMHILRECIFTSVGESIIFLAPFLLTWRTTTRASSSIFCKSHVWQASRNLANTLKAKLSRKLYGERRLSDSHADHFMHYVFLLSFGHTVFHNFN